MTGFFGCTDSLFDRLSEFFDDIYDHWTVEPVAAGQFGQSAFWLS
jgi:hypothetical protein